MIANEPGGCTATANGFGWQASIDEFQLYDRALSGEELRSKSTTLPVFGWVRTADEVINLMPHYQTQEIISLGFKGPPTQLVDSFGPTYRDPTGRS